MTEYNENNATPTPTPEEQLAQEQKTEAVNKLSELDYAWRYVSVGETPIGVFQQALTTAEKYSVPRKRAHDILRDWLEENKEDFAFTETIVGLIEPLAETLGVDIEVSDKFDIRIDATVHYSRKVWEDDEKIVEELLDNLSATITESYSDYLSDYEIDSIEVN
jgi:hypothetical protein